MNLKQLLIIPPLALGVLGYMWMTNGQSDVPVPSDPIAQTVRAMTVSEEPLTVKSTGYGRVVPVRSWSAVSQVDGRIIETTPDLAIGSYVSKGALLVQIDKTDYELAVAKAKSNIASSEAALEEITRQQVNTERLLESEMRILEVAEAEFLRVERLVSNGTSSQAALDSAEKTLINQQNAVISLENTLALYPAQRSSAEATQAVRETELAEAERRLENTTIVAPYDGRVSMETIEQGQYVRTGNELLSLDGVAKAEVVGAFQPREFGTLARAALGSSSPRMTEIDATKVIALLQQAGVTAHVDLQLSGGVARYPARLVRFRGTIDEQTGTVGIAVRVDDPLIAKANERRPPLEMNTFVSVVLEADLPGGAISIPRSALHQNEDGKPYVYVATEEDTLATALVTPGPVIDGTVVITSGLNDNDRVLLSNPRPAIVGMPLSVVEAGAAQ